MIFSVVADDHLLGVTHVIRGKDHIANTRRQRYIYDHFGWKVPVYRHYGRMGIEGVVLSTSQMRLGIKEGTYSGWDDIRLGTLRALARRGILPDAVKNAMLAIGIGETDISFSWDNLFSENRKIIDPIANRYFFVPDPVTVTIHAAPHVTTKALLHPADEKRGVRTLSFTGALILPAAELTDKTRTLLRLKDLFNVSVEYDHGRPHVTYAGDSLTDARAAKAPIIQWLPVGEQVSCTLRTPEGDVAGACEPAVRDEISKVVQFERVGFAKIDSITDDGIVAYFTHK
jgi:glutamyl-tRNA synthetase